MPSATESKPETRKVVSIVGPTASGKTGLGIAIAKALEAKGEQAEIVNADAYQMYKGMDIGTAKASPEEQAEVRHHLIDIIEPDDAMSVARFQEIARAKIAELQARGVRPILVGGSASSVSCNDTVVPLFRSLRKCIRSSFAILSPAHFQMEKRIHLFHAMTHLRQNGFFGAERAVPFFCFRGCHVRVMV